MDTAIIERMRAWRHDLHAHPELGFAEHRTAGIVAAALQDMGYAVHCGLGGTGVVGSLLNGQGPSIGLRADMDALPIQETTDRPHGSTRPGVMHACGHDGHTAMLLGAAALLARHRDHYCGTLHLIFQPAEENEGGGRAMVEQGLFERFPCDAVYGLHNWPGLPVGHFALQPGPMMAALDTFEITVQGKGCHAAMPERGTDPFMAVAPLLQGIQTIASRLLSPHAAAVVSVTQIHGGDTWNVLPDQVVLRGTVRCFDANVQDTIEAALNRQCDGTSAATGTHITLDYQRRYPATLNADGPTQIARRAAQAVAGPAQVLAPATPSMASEDFAFMLQARPGAYVWLGAGSGPEDAPLHNPGYDFNDALLPVGAAYWVQLVQTALPVPA